MRHERRGDHQDARAVQLRARASEAPVQRKADSGRSLTPVDDLSLSLSADPVQLDAFDDAVQCVWDAVAERQAASRRAIQRKAGKRARAAEVRAAAGRGVAGGGQALPHLEAIQASFGPGHDLSGIQAHVGGSAGEACDDMHAHGYATGDHVAFARTPSLHLAAHEAAHVVQQRSGAVRLSAGVGEVGDRWEQHADQVAERVAAGRSAADLLPGPGNAPDAGVQQSAIQLEEKPEAPAAAQAPAPAAGNAPAAGGAAIDSAAGAYKYKGPEIKLGEVELPSVPIKVKGTIAPEFYGKFESQKADGQTPAKDAPKDGEKPKEGAEAGGGEKPKEGGVEAPKDGDKPKEGGPKYGVEVNKIGGDKGVGYDAKVKASFDKIGAFKPEVAGSAEFTTQGGKLTVGGSIETEWGPLAVKPVKVEFNFIKVETKGAPEVKFLTLKLSSEAEYKGVKLPVAGGMLIGAAKLAVALELSPHYAEIGKHLAKLAVEKIAPQLRALVTTPAGLVAAASIGTLIAGLAFIGQQGEAGKELDSLSRTTVLECRRYCIAMIGALTGNEAKLVPGQGSTRGAADGQARLKELAEQAGVPLALVQAEAKEQLADPEGFYKQVWASAWPQMRQEAVTQYSQKIGWLARNLTNDVDKLGKLLDTHANGSTGAME